MDKKTIAFVISSNELGNWSGGVAYFVNLFNLLKQLKNFKIIIYTDSIEFLKKNNLGFFKVKEMKFLKKNYPHYYLRKLLIYFYKKDYLLYLALLKDNVSLLSHRKLFKNKNIRSIGWIADLQHRVLTKFFNNKYFSIREDYVIKEIKNSDKIFVSSHQVKKEFKKYYNLSKTIIPLKVPSNKKNISFKKSKNFILFPAQFWEHKNHKFLIKASEIIKRKKLDIRFYLCGKVENYKNNTYFNEINDSIKNKKLEKIIINLGEVSKQKLEELQNSCIAFMNPSFYEGWSTINEEARSKLKHIFLSKIPGHIEQNNYGSIYININSPDDCVEKIKNFLKDKKYSDLKNYKKHNAKYIKKISSEALKILSKEYSKS